MKKFFNSKSGMTLSLVFVVIVWGSAATVTKVGIEEIPPYAFAFLRNIVASLCLLPIYIYRRSRLSVSAEPIPYLRICAMSLTGIALFYLTFNLGLQYTSASSAALIQGFIPVAIILLAVLFLKERLTGLQIAGVVVSVAGVLLIGFVGHGNADGSLKGNLLIVGSVVCWGVYTIIAKTVNRHDPFIIISLSTFIGTALLVPIVLFENWGNELPIITSKAWGGIIYLGLFSSALCYVIYSNVMKVLPAVQVGNFMNLDPVAGAIIAVVVLGDKIGSWQWAGAALVIGGVFLSSRSPRQQKAAEVNKASVE